MLSGMSLPVSELDPPDRSSVPRVLGVVIAITLLAGLVSAVLVGNGADRSPAERFAAVAAAVSEDPFAFEISVEAQMPAPTASPIEFSITGAADPATTRTRAVMDMAGLVPAGAGADAPTTISFVSEGTTVYVQRGGVGRWTKVDGRALAQGVTSGMPSSTNPLDSFEQLRAVDSPIEEVGEEDVRGTWTTHYRTRLDMAKVLAAMPDEQRAASAALAEMADVPVDVWLDDEDRPRRQRMLFTVPGGAGTVTMTIEAFDFGTPVDIELPPADQVDDGTGTGVLVPPPN